MEKVKKTKKQTDKAKRKVGRPKKYNTKVDKLRKELAAAMNVVDDRITEVLSATSRLVSNKIADIRINRIAKIEESMSSLDCKISTVAKKLDQIVYGQETNYQPEEEPIVYHLGDKFKHTETGELYMLAPNLDAGKCLVKLLDINDGNWYSNYSILLDIECASALGNWHCVDIPEEEFAKLCYGDTSKFDKIDGKLVLLEKA